MPAFLKDVGMAVGNSRVRVDAAKSIAEREGLGKVRRIEVDLLWIQEQQMGRRLPLTKIDGIRNPADLMTKNLIRASIIKNLSIPELVEREGRSAKAAQLHSVEVVELQSTHEIGGHGKRERCSEVRSRSLDLES